MSRLLLLLHSRTLTSHLCNSTLTPTLTQTQSLSPSPSFPLQLQTFSFRSSFSSKTKNSKQQEQEQEEADKVGNEAKNKNKKINNSSSESSVRDSDYPSGEFQLQEFSWWRKLTVKLMMLTALPRERIPNATFLTMKIRGEIFEQLESRYSSELSLPQICENIIKAAYDPRISGIYLHIETLSCGWAKIDEIQRHILDFKKSGKFIVAYVPECCEEEYYLACACEEIYVPPSAYFSLFGLTVEASFLRGVLDNVGIEPEVERIGKYKSAGDLLTSKTMSEENCEMLTALLDNVYENWLDKVSSAKGKTREDLENFINQGVYQVEKLKEEGWITNISYDDEVISMLRERLGLHKDEQIPMVDYSEYSRVRKWTLGLSGGEDQIAVIRASGSISRIQSPFSDSSSDIIEDEFIEKIRSVRESKRYKAAIIRIDSPGGDALASDLMWREIKLLAASKPVIASMSDVAASGGYYMAMAAGTIVAENLTLTGSIGVVTGRFNLGKLYGKIGFNKEIISRGKYAELHAAEQRPLRSDEAELLAKYAQHAYTQFRNKAAFSRSMPVDKMEEVAQGRIWTGKDAASRGLVDAIGGLSRVVAIAKLKANIPQDR
ncbi:serine protease SPPA, chloroplastic-like [Quercus lobata]|uniref:serine protease SPPA, chloroplastic-like n=1 Tax=Quercus lobata TaxID=97700 RepID=UPI0012474DAD|nr:serine protease SPPA, chloroplastic-like [Quercus lobata]